MACGTCRRDLEHALATLPSLVPLLDLLLERGGRPPEGSRGSGRAEAPIPPRLDVLTLIGPGNPTPPIDEPEGGGVIPVLPLLSGWAHYIAQQHRAGWRGLDDTVRVEPAAAIPRHGTTVAGWCTWLLAYLPYALTQPWTDELHHQLLDLLARCERITGTPAGTIHDAPCPHCNLCALVQHGHTGAMCEACGERVTTAQYTTAAAAANPSESVRLTQEAR